MKKLILIAIITLMPLTGFSQSLFDKYEDLDKVTTIVVNQSMFRLLSNIDVEVDDKDTQDFMDIAQSLKNLKMFSTEDKSISAEMKASVSQYLKSSSMEELMRIKDEDKNIKFYIKNGKDDNHVSELLMFITGLEKANVDIKGHKIETVLLSLTGDIDLRKISSLTKKMNLPEELNKAGKNK